MPGQKWIDLVVWVPSLGHMVIHRIARDEDAIEALEADMLAFAKLVSEQEAKLRAALKTHRLQEAV